MKYLICNSYTNAHIKTCKSEKEVLEFIGREAEINNCGIFRFWEKDNIKYYDCGPTTYSVTEFDSPN